MEENIDYIINLLNRFSGSDYKLKTVKTRKVIRARLNDGFGLGDFEDVIRFKTLAWRGTQWEQFLRPETLFGNKFESYLQASRKPGPESMFAKANRQIAESREKLKTIFKNDATTNS